MCIAIKVPLINNFLGSQVFISRVAERGFRFVITFRCPQMLSAKRTSPNGGQTTVFALDNSVNYWKVGRRSLSVIPRWVYLTTSRMATAAIMSAIPLVPTTVMCRARQWLRMAGTPSSGGSHTTPSVSRCFTESTHHITYLESLQCPTALIIRPTNSSVHD